MISQEVTVDVHNVPEAGGSASSSDDGNGESMSRPSYEGQGEGAIELRTLKGGKGTSSNIEAEGIRELVTFVDELYALCLS